jgi:predicted Zn-dependent protease
MRLLLAIILSVATLSFGQDAPGPNDTVLRAMSDELARSVAELRLGNLDKPYFIQYIVLDEEEYAAQATFGAITSSDRSLQRYVQAQVRVGTYDFDNSEFVSGPNPASTGVLLQTVLDDDYENLRHTLWLATDNAYKQSVEVLARKRAFVQNKIQEVQPPDFSKEDPTHAVSGARRLEVDKARIEAQLREWSRIFKEYPAIQTSNLRLIARLVNRYIVNTEGTRTLQPTMIVSLEVGASVQASDGMRISHALPFNARSLDQLPAPESIAQSIRQLASDLTMLRSAPVLDANYSGPVLLTGQASAEMFARILAPNLSGQRGPMNERQPQQTTDSDLVDRMNRPVLPPYFSVFDDPAQVRSGDHSLIGHYQVDDQGIPSQRVMLIEDGLLRNMLMGRRPGKHRHQSNGHGRSGYPGLERAQIGNLFIAANEGMNYDELKQELIRLGNLEKIDYALVIKSLDSSGRGPIGAPILAYKVYMADGREELIRGATVRGLSVQSLRHIQAAGNDMFVANRLTGTRGAETPVSVIAPSVLLEEMELERPTGVQQKPALLEHPYFLNQAQQ